MFSIILMNVCLREKVFQLIEKPQMQVLGKSVYEVKIFRYVLSRLCSHDKKDIYIYIYIYIYIHIYLSIYLYIFPEIRRNPTNSLSLKRKLNIRVVLLSK